jgi:hypothetical protein
MVVTRRSVVALAPFAGGVLYLLLVLAAYRAHSPWLGSNAVEGLPAAFWTEVVVVGALLRARHRRWALLAPCFLAPLAVTSAWTAQPDHLGGASFEGFAFFLRWLTRYPNLGPVNRDVLLGILCVLGASSVPTGFGAHVLRVPTMSRRVIAAWLAVDLVAYLPVLVKLDGPAVATYVSALGAGTHSALLAPGPISGAILRLFAVVAMIVASVRGLPDEES